MVVLFLSMMDTPGRHRTVQGRLAGSQSQFSFSERPSAIALQISCVCCVLLMKVFIQHTHRNEIISSVPSNLRFQFVCFVE